MIPYNFRVNRNGSWSEWSPFSNCSVTSICGSGSRTRTRQCNHKLNDGGSCIGDPSETKRCLAHNCYPQVNVLRLAMGSSINDPTENPEFITNIILNELPVFGLSSGNKYLESSWIGVQQSCDDIKVVTTHVILDDLFNELKSKCLQKLTRHPLYNIGHLDIIADTVLLNGDLELSGLRKLDIETRRMVVQSEAKKLSFLQSIPRKGRDASSYGNRGGDGSVGAHGTQVVIKSLSMHTQG